MTLPDYIAARLTTPFRWGAHDCITFTIGWAEIATGNRYLPETLWADEYEAMRQVRSLGGLPAIFDRHFRRIEPNRARDGDLCVVDGVASLFTGPYVVAVGERGLIYKKRTEVKDAWTY